MIFSGVGGSIEGGTTMTDARQGQRVHSILIGVSSRWTASRRLGAALLVAICSMALVLSANPGTAANIYWDDAHDTDGDSLTGNFSQLAALLTAAGHNVFEGDQELTASALVGYHLLVIVDPELPLTTAEISAIHLWLEAGGHGLWVLGESYPTFDIVSVNQLIDPTFIVFYDFDVTGETSAVLLPHPITLGVSTVPLCAAGEIGVPLSFPPTETLAFTDTYFELAGVYQRFNHRILVWGDASTFENSCLGGDWDTLALNSVRWAHELINTIGFEDGVIWPAQGSPREDNAGPPS
jgi:hypothetical protein